VQVKESLVSTQAITSCLV